MTHAIEHLRFPKAPIETVAEFRQLAGQMLGDDAVVDTPGISFDNGDPNVLGGFGTYQNDQQFLAYNAELVYSITDNWGVSAYYESGTNGKNIISAPVLNFSVFFTH